MKAPKQAMSLLFAFLILLTVFTGCNGSPGASQAASGADAEDGYNGLLEIYAGIDPLETVTALRYAGSVGLQLSVPLYISYITGGLESAGVEFNHLPTATGPLSVEALTAGEVDFIGTGIGGIAVGAANGTAKMLCYINEDSVIQKFFVAKDSPLANAPFNAETGLCGTADDWRGLEVYMPPGTTLQYLMGTAMGKLGLTLQDIKPVYMDANNVNTALYAKQGDVWGIWNFLCYASALEEEGYVAVVEGSKVGINLVTAFATNDTVWNDPQRRAAIEKVLELHFVTLDWMKSDPRNMEIAARITTEWSEAEGTAVSFEENLAYLNETYYYNLDENYQMFGNKITNDHGEMPEALDVLQGIMDFYVEQGNYTEADRVTMIRNQADIFPLDALDAVKASRG